MLQGTLQGIVVLEQPALPEQFDCIRFHPSISITGTDQADPGTSMMALYHSGSST
jgi:hypothetical protein